MPKMKTKSSAKKRFKVTASGRIKSAQAGKRHGMIKRTTKIHPQCTRHDGTVRTGRTYRQEIHALRTLRSLRHVESYQR